MIFRWIYFALPKFAELAGRKGMGKAYSAAAVSIFCFFYKHFFFVFLPRDISSNDQGQVGHAAASVDVAASPLKSLQRSCGCICGSGICICRGICICVFAPKYLYLEVGCVCVLCFFLEGFRFQTSNLRISSAAYKIEYLFLVRRRLPANLVASRLLFFCKSRFVSIRSVRFGLVSFRIIPSALALLGSLLILWNCLKIKHRRQARNTHTQKAHTPKKKNKKREEPL